MLDDPVANLQVPPDVVIDNAELGIEGEAANEGEESSNAASCKGRKRSRIEDLDGPSSRSNVGLRHSRKLG